MANQPIISDQEIDLAQVSKKFRNAVSRTNDKLFDGILFLKRNIVLVILVIIAGAALGWYMDREKVYTTKMFVIPNFGSVDYLYSKVELMNAKIRERDEEFFKESGVGGNVAHLKIEPVIDIYKFIDEGKENNKNYEIFRLMAENDDVENVMGDTPTGKHFKTHLITVTTSGKSTRETSVEPILKYLNYSPYYEDIKAEGIKNLERKITSTDTTLKQIDAILNDSRSKKGENMMYFNDATPLNEVIKLKTELTTKQGENRIALINAQTLIHDSGAVLNEKNTKGLNGKNKFLMPLLFMLLFLLISGFVNYYRRQMNKRRIANV